MRMRTFFVLAIAAFFMFLTAGLSLSQDEQQAPQEIKPAVEAGEAQEEPQVQWVWGEVVSLDAENKTITVKYLDYETDQEKEISVGVGDSTTYENVKSFDEIKPQDSVSIDYTVGPDGKAVAKNISLEMPEEPPVPAPVDTGAAEVESVPQEVQPAMPVEQ